MNRTLVAFALFVSAASALSAQVKPADKPLDRPATKKVAVGKTVWPDEGPAKWAPRPTETAITANDLRTRLYQLADDSMAGRRIGELGNYKGTEYIAKEFKRLGLKPAGDNGGYFQELPYGPMGFDSTTVRFAAGGSAATAKSEWIPMGPTPAAGVGGKADLNNVATIYAGRFGDTTVVFDPALFRGKVAVFSGAPPGGAGGRGAAAVLRCDSVPNKFGARAAAECGLRYS